MNIKISKPVLFAIFAAIFGLGAYWYWSPFLAIRQMQSAAKAGDADTFNDFVDYPKLRESLKGQLSAVLAEKMGDAKKSDNPFAAFGSALGLLVVDKMVDAMVRPELVMKGLQNGKFGPKAQQADGDSGAGAKEAGQRWDYDRRGLDKLVAYARDDTGADNKRVGLVFERNGFANWKLTEIRLPALKL